MDVDERRFNKWLSRNQSCPLVDDVEGHCWIWVGARNSSKQAVFWVAGRMAYAAVWYWERETGQTKPQGMQLSPRCGNSMCCRPSHRQLRPRGSHIKGKIAA